MFDPSATDSGASGLRALFALPENMLYLDSAAHGPPLRSVRSAGIQALQRSTTSWFGGGQWREDVERVRALAAQLFDDDDDAIAMVPSAGYGLSVAARNVPLSPGQSVLVLDGQFPSNLLPWRQRCAQVGAHLHIVRRAGGQDWTSAVLAALDADHDIGVLALPQAYWRDGALLDLTRISSAARARAGQTRLILDLSQSLGALPLQLEGWQPDFVVAVGYKWLLGGYGLAWLWAAPQWRDHGQPLEHSWMAHDRDALWSPGSDAAIAPLAGARRFDAGGVCDAPRLAMAEAGLRQVLDWGVPWIASELRQRTDALDAGLDANGLGALRTAGHAAHFCGVRPPAAKMEAVAAALSHAGVVVTRHYDCLRIAPHLHVTADEMTQVAELIAAAMR